MYPESWSGGALLAVLVDARVPGDLAVLVNGFDGHLAALVDGVDCELVT